MIERVEIAVTFTGPGNRITIDVRRPDRSVTRGILALLDELLAPPPAEREEPAPDDQAG